MDQVIKKGLNKRNLKKLVLEQTFELCLWTIIPTQRLISAPTPRTSDGLGEGIVMKGCKRLTSDVFDSLNRFKRVTYYHLEDKKEIKRNKGKR